MTCSKNTTKADVQVLYLNLGLVTARYLSQETATIMNMEQHRVNLKEYFICCSNLKAPPVQRIVEIRKY